MDRRLHEALLWCFFFSSTVKQLLHLSVLIYRKLAHRCHKHFQMFSYYMTTSTNRSKPSLETSLNLIQLTPLFLLKTRWRVVVMAVAVNENLDLMHPLP